MQVVFEFKPNDCLSEVSKKKKKLAGIWHTAVNHNYATE